MHILPDPGIARKRQQVWATLSACYSNDITAGRELEASIHASSHSLEAYVDKSQQIVYNLMSNPKLLQVGLAIVVYSDNQLADGTIIDDIQKEANARRVRFEEMLEHKYELMNEFTLSEKAKATLKCRRCGSPEITWDQKQTRSADEASTVFCVCNKCNNRWTMR